MIRNTPGQTVDKAVKISKRFCAFSAQRGYDLIHLGRFDGETTARTQYQADRVHILE